jgi:hypothetical protein
MDDQRHVMRTPDVLAVGALGLATVASVAGILVTGLYRDGPEAIRQARATDLVTLLLGVPALGLGLWQARAGSTWGRAVAVGALGYLAYSYAIYAFSVVINAMTPVHIAILGLAAWSLVLVSIRIDVRMLVAASPIRMPRRSTGVFLVTVGAMFGLLWLGQIAGAITSGVLPPSVSDLALPTSPVYALDLAFAIPLLLLAGGWLMRSDDRAAFAAAAAVAFVVVMAASVLAIFVVDGAAGVAIEAPPVVIFGLVAGIGVALLGNGLASSRPGRALHIGTQGA